MDRSRPLNRLLQIASGGSHFISGREAVFALWRREEQALPLPISKSRDSAREPSDLFVHWAQDNIGVFA
jgi:hypothetical protein